MLFEVGDVEAVGLHGDVVACEVVVLEDALGEEVGGFLSEHEVARAAEEGEEEGQSAGVAVRGHKLVGRDGGTVVYGEESGEGRAELWEAVNVTVLEKIGVVLIELNRRSFADFGEWEHLRSRLADLEVNAFVYCWNNVL